MTMPLTVLLTIALIGLAMQMYFDFSAQVEKHQEETANLYQVKEVDAIRLYDKMENTVTE